MWRTIQDNFLLVPLQGYAVAWCEQENFLSMVLLKYFAKEYKKEWLAEVDLVQGLSCNGEFLSNLLHYRWHSKGKKYCVSKNMIYINFLYSFRLSFTYTLISIDLNKTFWEKNTYVVLYYFFIFWYHSGTPPQRPPWGQSRESKVVVIERWPLVEVWLCSPCPAYSEKGERFPGIQLAQSSLRRRYKLLTSE